MRDSHGLYDYESRSIKKKSMRTQHESRIARINNDIEVYPMSKREADLGLDAQSLFFLKSD